jgi:hypothetical protein
MHSNKENSDPQDYRTMNHLEINKSSRNYSSSAIVTYRPPLASISENDEQESEKPKQALLSSRPPRWTEDEVSEGEEQV